VTLDSINAMVTIATLVLLTATALAGLIQLRHMRAGNVLSAAQAIARDFRAPAFQAALKYAQDELPARIEDAGYRRQLGAPGYVDPRTHPEMMLCNLFNRTGGLMRGGLIDEAAFLDSYGRLVLYYWELLAPVVAILRRTRGPGQYAGFEYLAYQAAQRAARRPPARRPSRAALADPWLAQDVQPGSS